MRRYVSVTLVMAMVALLAGCGAEKQQTLKVVAAYGGKEKIFQQFTRDTGIKVEFIDMSSGEVLARSVAEGGKPMADVWFGGGLDSFVEAKTKGYLEPYQSAELDNIDPKYRDKELYWYGVSLVMAGLMVNTEQLAKRGLPLPVSWDDLAGDKYRDEIMFANPAVSGTSFAFIAGMLSKKGDAGGWEYMQKLAANVPYFSKRGGDPPVKVAAGEAVLGVVPMSGEFAQLMTTAPVKAYFPKGGIPWTPAGLAIFKNCAHQAEARQFVDWALSQKGQTAICASDPRLMTRRGMPAPEFYKGISEQDLISVDFDSVLQNRARILEKWKSITKGK